FQKYGRRCLSHFDESCEAEGATGDLTAICRAYLAAEGDALREVQAFSRWAEGAELKGNRSISGVRGSLDAHTGQRIFGELTRLVRALGHGGLLVVLSEAHSIAKCTERQREKAYTLLREFVDNFDSGRGAVATRITITGGDEFFSGSRSLQTLAPLYARIALPSGAEPPPPHRTWTSLIRDPYEYIHRAPRPMKEA